MQFEHKKYEQTHGKEDALAPLSGTDLQNIDSVVASEARCASPNRYRLAIAEMNGRKRQRPLEVSFFFGDGPPMVAFQGSPNRTPIASVSHTFRVRFHEIWDTCRGGLALHKFLGRTE